MTYLHLNNSWTVKNNEKLDDLSSLKQQLNG